MPLQTSCPAAESHDCTDCNVVRADMWSDKHDEDHYLHPHSPLSCLSPEIHFIADLEGFHYRPPE
jgi:hypothetical protein